MDIIEALVRVKVKDKTRLDRDFFVALFGIHAAQLINSIRLARQ